jgi:hypothetical protein
MNKKQLFIIQPHSFIDVITNSSSELFIVKTDKTLETVRGILQKLIDVHNEADDGHYIKTFNDTFGDIFVISKTTPPVMIDNLIDTLENYSGGGDNFGIKFSTCPQYDDFRIPRLTGDDGSDLYERARKEWIQKNRPKILKNCAGMVVIYSEGDNSIPGPIMEFIDQSFNSQRWHLG